MLTTFIESKLDIVITDLSVCVCVCVCGGKGAVVKILGSQSTNIIHIASANPSVKRVPGLVLHGVDMTIVCGKYILPWPMWSSAGIIMAFP